MLEKLSRNRFDVILRHDWLIEQCLLRIRVLFCGKTTSPCFDLFIDWLIKQITNTYRNHFSRSYENRSIRKDVRFKNQQLNFFITHIGSLDLLIRQPLRSGNLISSSNFQLRVRFTGKSRFYGSSKPIQNPKTVSSVNLLVEKHIVKDFFCSKMHVSIL